MKDGTSNLQDFTANDLLEVLVKMKKEFPATYRWFIIWELEKLNDSRKSNQGLG